MSKTKRIFIVGHSGAGKDVLAGSISHRHSKPILTKYGSINFFIGLCIV